MGGSQRPGSMLTPLIQTCRPGYMMSTTGMWPYSYNSCRGDLSGTEREGANKPQKITACPDPPGFNRTLYGLLPGQGRGAPEIDMVEMK